MPSESDNDTMMFEDVYQRKQGLAGGIPLESDKFPASFPLAIWTAQTRRYDNYWYWFTGEVWKQTIPGDKDKNNNPIIRYPLAINHFKQTAMKRSYVIFGEVADGPNCLIPPKITPRKKRGEIDVPEERKRIARETQDFLNEVWNENRGRSLQREQGLIQQILGGCVFRLMNRPDEPELRNHMRLAAILPDFFLPVADPEDPDTLLEAFIVYRIAPREAMHLFGGEYGESDPYLLYVEHWTCDTINITLNGEPVNYTCTITDDETGEKVDVEMNYDNQENPFGFVPIVYIPNERFGSYWGPSAGDDVFQLSREINARMADNGDSISEMSHSDVYIKNVRGGVSTTDLGGGRSAINLGISQNGQAEPDATRVPPADMPESLVQWPKELAAQYGRDTFVPPVANGEDEGSQRSALTLAFRMWPLVAKVRAIRDYWQDGLNRLNRMIIKMAIEIGIEGITQAHLDECDFAVEWSPIIPRDREQEVNEAVLMMQSNSLSPRTALENLRTVTDPDDEYARIQEHLEWFLGLQADLAAKSAMKKVSTQTASPTASTGLDNK